jgi:hypothetical protein
MEKRADSAAIAQTRATRLA